MTEEEILAASWTWERHGGRVACPDCGARGFPGGRWVLTHLEHVECPHCHRTLSRRGLGPHVGASGLQAHRRAVAEVMAGLR